MFILVICCCNQDIRQANEPAGSGTISGEVRAKKSSDSVIYVGLGTSLDEISSGKCVKFIALRKPGRFHMEDVPPGKYCLSAFIDLNSDERPDILLEPYYIHRTEILVAPGQKIRDIIVEGFFNERDPSFKTAERTKEYSALRDSASVAIENAYRKLRAEGGALFAELMPTLRAMVFEAEETWAVAGNDADWEHIRALLEPLPELASDAARGIDGTNFLRGCFLRAYLSELDGTVQRYAIHVPEEYDGSQPFPLVIALHTSGGDHWSGLKLVTGYSNILRSADEANRHFFPAKLPSDFIVVSPNGYGFEGPGYRGPAEYDVMKVLEEVESHYKIDRSRIYLTGASKGGQGTWEIGLKHPELFAAIAPVCGATGGVRTMASQIGRVPIFVFHGAKDRITSVNESRVMIAAARRLVKPPKYQYFEYPEWGHFATYRVYENGAIFDLFRGESRPSA